MWEVIKIIIKVYDLSLWRDSGNLLGQKPEQAPKQERQQEEKHQCEKRECSVTILNICKNDSKYNIGQQRAEDYCRCPENISKEEEP